jgi:Tol biopolymer transport system component
LAQELEGMRADRSESSSFVRREEATTPRRSWNRFLWPAIGVAGAAILAFTLFGPRHGPQVNPNVRIAPLHLPFEQTGYPGLSRDGQWLAVPATDLTGRPGLYLTNVHGGVQRLIFSSPDLWWIDYADISPDGSRIVFSGFTMTNDTEVRVVPVLGGEDRLVGKGSGAQWRPDGQRIGYLVSGWKSRSGYMEIWSVRPDGRDAKVEFIDSTFAGKGRQGFTWSPDGRRIAYTRSLDKDTRQVIMIRDLASGRTRQITHEHEVIDELCWTSRGDIVFSSDRSGAENLWVVRASGGAATQLTRGPGPDLGIRVSADGATVLCTQYRPTGQVWIGNLATGAAQQVTRDEVNPELATLSPDGRHVAIAIAEADPFRKVAPLYITNRDGSGRRQITGDGSYVTQTDWSVDGRRLAYAAVDSTRGDSFYIWVVDLPNGSPSRQIARGRVAWWMSDSTLLVADYTRTRLLLMPQGRVLQESEDSTFDYPYRGYTVFYDTRSGRTGLWLRKPGPGTEILRPLDLSPSEIISFPRRAPFILCLNDSLGLFRYWVLNGRRERLTGNYPGLTFSSGTVMNWDDREFAYVARGKASRMLLITGLRR